MQTPPLFLETVKIHEGRIRRLPYHQQRMERTIRAHYPDADIPQLQAQLHKVPTAGIYKCRILYTDRIQTVTFEPYTPKPVRTFTIIESEIDYAYKYADRSHLENLKATIPTDEIIIQKAGLLTDTSYSNLAFYDGTGWLTPRTPLLTGTMRTKLLEEGRIEEADILPDDLHRFKEIALMNAMIEFKVLKNARIFDRSGRLLFQKEGYDRRNHYGGLLK
jgi:4-amino-4-deoxychorismate lyase